MAGGIITAPPETLLIWQELPSLPPAPGKTTQPGVAGPFVGVHKGALIVAGGANFPERLPWDGGTKVWHDDGFVMTANGGRFSWNSQSAFKLPRPLAYGYAFSTDEGVVCAGGCDANRCFADVFMLKYDPSNRDVSRFDLPALPKPLAFMSGALIDRTCYLVGGQETMANATGTKNFFALDLDAVEAGWKVLPVWPGSERILPVAFAQHDDRGDRVFVFSGRAPHPQAKTQILADGYRYDPARRTWSSCRDLDHAIMAATMLPVDEAQVLVFGGADGKRFLELEEIQMGRDALLHVADGTADLAESAALRERAYEMTRRHTDLQIQHTGFPKNILAYDTLSDRWRKVGDLPTTSHVTTQAVWWNGRIIIGPGEIRPGVRTPRIWSAKVRVGTN